MRPKHTPEPLPTLVVGIMLQAFAGGACVPAFGDLGAFTAATNTDGVASEDATGSGDSGLPTTGSDSGLTTGGAMAYGPCDTTDPLIFKPEPYVWIEKPVLDHVCTLLSVGPAMDDPGLLMVDFQCKDQGAVSFGIYSGPMPDWSSRIGTDLSVELRRSVNPGTGLWEESAHLRDETLGGTIYFGVRGNAFPNLDRLTIVPDSQTDICPSGPVESAGPGDLGCKAANPGRVQMTSSTGVEGDLTIHQALVGSGESAELPAYEGTFVLEVRRAVSAHDCSPDKDPLYGQLYAYAVAFHAD